MTISEAINNLKRGKCIPYKHETLTLVIKNLEALGKLDDEIASLQDTYSIGNTFTEKLIWENLHAVRKSIHEYLKEVQNDNKM